MYYKQMKQCVCGYNYIVYCEFGENHVLAECKSCALRWIYISEETAWKKENGFEGSGCKKCFNVDIFATDTGFYCSMCGFNDLLKGEGYTMSKEEWIPGEEKTCCGGACGACDAKAPIESVADGDRISAMVKLMDSTYVFAAIPGASSVCASCAHFSKEYFVVRCLGCRLMGYEPKAGKGR